MYFMLGVIVNVFTVLLGSTIGLLCKKGIPEKLTQAVMLGIGLCTLYIGISGTLQGENTLVLIISIVIGAMIGTLLDIAQRINQLELREAMCGVVRYPMATSYVSNCNPFAWGGNCNPCVNGAQNF